MAPYAFELCRKTDTPSLWRSETMVLLEMTMQREVAHKSIELLGELGCVEFKDMSSKLSAFQRHYANEIKRCEELERGIRFFQEKTEKANVKFSESLDMNADSQMHEIHDIDVSSNILDTYERVFSKLEQEVRKLTDGMDEMVAEKSKSEEYLTVINLAGNISSTEGNQSSNNSTSFGFLTGVIPSEKVSAFKMLIYRSTRGNAIPKLVEIPSLIYDPKIGKSISKVVFTVFFGAFTARDKIRKICEAMGATMYDLPLGQENSNEEKKIEQQIREFELTIENSQVRLLNVLSEISHQLPQWKERVHREKAVYHTLNLCNFDIRNSVVACGWTAERNVELVRKELETAMIESNSIVPSLCDVIHTEEIPPTYFESNKFTEVFQQVVNSYGIPSYKELNPAVPSVIFFPFLFAIMFGDFGHGLLLALFSLSMVIFERKLKPIAENNELLIMVFQGRYILILMGLFSIYTGFLYNDGFGLSVDIFPTAFHFNNGIGHKDDTRTYPFGIDPAWFHTSNKLLFYNSLKMKMAIIFGVGHMTSGLFFSLANMIHFGHYLDIFLVYSRIVNFVVYFRIHVNSNHLQVVH